MLWLWIMYHNWHHERFDDLRCKKISIHFWWPSVCTEEDPCQQLNKIGLFSSHYDSDTAHFQESSPKFIAKPSTLAEKRVNIYTNRRKWMWYSIFSVYFIANVFSLMHMLRLLLFSCQTVDIVDIQQKKKKKRNTNTHAYQTPTELWQISTS